MINRFLIKTSGMLQQPHQKEKENRWGRLTIKNKGITLLIITIIFKLIVIMDNNNNSKLNFSRRTMLIVKNI